jgi:aspartyl-tRNA(Asn)/glutamyl-tRNA(Gln) amidotransferase subunit C
MRVDEELIKHVSKVARINLSDAEIERFVPQFKEILEAFSVLDEVDVIDTKMSIQPIEVRNVLREDMPMPSFLQEDALSQAKNNKKDGYFKGPKAV